MERWCGRPNGGACVSLASALATWGLASSEGFGTARGATALADGWTHIDEGQLSWWVAGCKSPF